jgi:cell division protein DivIC
MKNFFTRLLSTLAITSLVVYATMVLVEQEKQLNNLDNEIERYSMLIDEATIKTEELEEIKSKINSDEYIENYAREKLGLVMPYEIIFVDASL